MLPKRREPKLVLLRDPKLREQGEDGWRNWPSQVKRSQLSALRRARPIARHQRADMYLQGTNPFELFAEMARRTPIEPAHAFYLGYELAKAVTALTLGKNYVQDQALRWGFLTVPERKRIDPHRTTASASKGIASSRLLALRAKCTPAVAFVCWPRMRPSTKTRINSKMMTPSDTSTIGSGKKSNPLGRRGLGQRFRGGGGGFRLRRRQPCKISARISDHRMAAVRPWLRRVVGGSAPSGTGTMISPATSDSGPPSQPSASRCPSTDCSTHNEIESAYRSLGQPH